MLEKYEDRKLLPEYIDQKAYTKCSTCGNICVEWEKTTFQFIIKFSGLSFKETVMIWVINVVVYLEIIIA